MGTDTVDFFDAEDFEDEDFTELLFFDGVLFDFDDVLFDEEDRVAEDRDEEARPFCASDPIGSSRSAAIRIKTIRGRIAPCIIGSRCPWCKE